MQNLKNTNEIKGTVELVEGKKRYVMEIAGIVMQRRKILSDALDGLLRTQILYSHNSNFCQECFKVQGYVRLISRGRYCSGLKCVMWSSNSSGRIGVWE